MTARPRRRAAGRIAAAALLALAASAPQPGAETEAWARAEAASYRERHHLSARAVDVDALAAEARRRSEQAGSSAGLDAWLGDTLARAALSFAPTEARPDPAARYALPFDATFPRVLGQGAGGRYSHTGSDYHSFDFVMPVGTPVHAAREGVVERVIDGFTEGGTDPRLKPFANAALVLHADGTFAQYAHLAPGGIEVQEGQRVSRGQVLAASGQTGWSGAPHLHFAVHRMERGEPRTIPIRFGPPGAPGFVPEQGTYVGAPPNPTLTLRLHADGDLVRPGRPRPVRNGQRVKVRVEALAGGAARDVTNDPRLHLVSMTPWSLAVSGPGELVFQPMAEFPEGWSIDTELAAVGVFFLNRPQREIGLGKIEFQIVDRAQDAATR